MIVSNTQIDPFSISQQRLHIIVRGIVQGMGFRPFIYRLATELELVGWVNNSSQGVEIDVEGARSQLDLFLHRLKQDKPARSLIQQVEFSILNPVGYSTFEIRASADGEKTTSVLPDLSICSECLKEIFEPTNRRYRYPFTNCTHCGPRFSLIEALPYDRCHTTMRHFTMCQQCQSEYEDPLNRRFHAQPNACPQCGPHLELWDQQGRVLATHDQALQMAAVAIRQGYIVGIKGLGGFHLMVDAQSEAAVQRLRRTKHRPAKPLALMYPSLERVKANCEISDVEANVLQSSAAPIVLLKQFKIQSPSSEIAPSVAPHNPYLGIMLPYTPLHHLLMNDLGFPVVATSGNLSNEPICIDESEVLQRLGQVAAVFLVHNRPIAQAVDDSVVRVLSGQETVLRRARGYAPLPTSIDSNLKIQNSKLTVLAVGAHLKNTIAFSIDQQAFISQHIGDLETVAAVEALHRVVTNFQTLYDLQPTAIACDLHPDYRSTQLAEQLAQQLNIPLIPVQHHYAHVLSCMAEHQLKGTALGIAWDGTGYGLDGTIWGGEFLHVTDTSFQRVAHLRPFRLPGGDKAIREPRRSAIGLLYELLDNAVFENLAGDDYSLVPPMQAFSDSELQVLKTMLHKNLNTPITSSMGRLFDAIAAIIGLRQQNQFEGQAAMELESAIAGSQIDHHYPFRILNLTNASLLVDWTEMIQSILLDIKAGVSIDQLSAMFHNTLVEMIVAVAKRVEEPRVILTGGCFQNKYLTERTIQRLKIEGFQPYCHRSIPPNDGGIAIGQLIAALRQLTGAKSICV